MEIQVRKIKAKAMNLIFEDIDNINGAKRTRTADPLHAMQANILKSVVLPKDLKEQEKELEQKLEQNQLDSFTSKSSLYSPCNFAYSKKMS